MLRCLSWPACLHLISPSGYGLLLLPCRFSRVRLCATPETAAHQAPPSLGFSRQEHWSGLPFPSPMHESENESEVAQLCPTPSDPMDCSLPDSSVHRIFQARVLEWGAIAFSDLFHRGIQLTGNQVIPRASQVALVVKNPSANAGDVGSIPGLGGSPGEGYGNQFQYSAWRITWTGEPGGLQSMGLQRVRHD